MQFTEEVNELKDGANGNTCSGLSKIDIQKIKSRNSNYEFGKFGSFKDFKESSLNHE